MKDKTDILIIHLNGEEVIRNCLKSIYKNTTDFNVYLLLNNSTDKSGEIVKKEFPKVKTFTTKKTIGFAEGCNFLAKKAQSKYIVLLNNDTIVEKNWLSEMIKTYQKHPNCIAVQPKVKSYYKRDEFEYAGAAGGFIDKYGFPFCRGRIFSTVEKDKGQYNDEKRIFWSCGVCMLVNRKKFLEFGAFDESLFMYAEETDFCWRTNIYGKDIWYCPKSTIYHMGSYTIKKKKLNIKREYLTSRNHILLLLKNYSLWSLIKVMPMRIVLELVAAVRFFPNRTVGVAMSLIGTPYTFIRYSASKRKEIQKRRERIDSDISELMYPKSLAFAYFIEGKKYFKDLNMKNDKK